MKKKIISILTVLTLSFTMMACGAKAPKDNAASGADGEAEGEIAYSNELKDPSDIKIGLVLDVGGVNDGSFNQLAWEGLQRAMEVMGVQGEYRETVEEGDYEKNISALMDDNCDLIVCVGFMLADATREAATAHPDQKFAIIDDASCADLPNVECLMFKQEQCSYLVGYVAGLTTTTDAVGFELGMASEAMHLFGYGYLAGVKDANPNAVILQKNADSFGNLDKGYADAVEMAEQNVDVIFHAAGGTGVGVINACAELGISAIGVDSDQHAVAEGTVITSAMKRVDNAVYNVVNQIVVGIFEGGIASYDINTGGVDIAPTTDYLSPEVIKEIESVKNKLVRGEIVVPANQSDFNSAYGDIYELD